MAPETPDWSPDPRPVPPELIHPHQHADPPEHIVHPADVDEDQHPTGAWTVGELLDAETVAKLREQFGG